MSENQSVNRSAFSASKSPMELNFYFRRLKELFKVSYSLDLFSSLSSQVKKSKYPNAIPKLHLVFLARNSFANFGKYHHFHVHQNQEELSI